MTKFAASNARREAVIADGYLLVDIAIGKVVWTLGHSTDEHTNALIGVQRVNVFPYTYYWGVKAERYLSALGWKMVCDGILDDTQELFLGISRANGKPVK